MAMLCYGQNEKYFAKYTLRKNQQNKTKTHKNKNWIQFFLISQCNSVGISRWWWLKIMLSHSHPTIMMAADAKTTMIPTTVMATYTKQLSGTTHLHIQPLWVHGRKQKQQDNNTIHSYGRHSFNHTQSWWLVFRSGHDKY